MLAALLCLTVLFAVYTLASAGVRFLDGFAQLLTGANVRRGLLSVFSGRYYAAGTYRGRDVAVRLQLKRSRYGRGFLVVAMRTTGTSHIKAADVDAHVRDSAGRHALSELADLDLRCAVEEGWLKALWTPEGFRVFPGRFERERWERALIAIETVARSLEETAVNR